MRQPTRRSTRRSAGGATGSARTRPPGTKSSRSSAERRAQRNAQWRPGARVSWAALTIATAIFLIAIGAILRYAINVTSDVINIQTVGLILMIAGGAGLALSLLYELVQQGPRDRDEPPRRGGYDDPTRRM